MTKHAAAEIWPPAYSQDPNSPEQTYVLQSHQQNTQPLFATGCTSPVDPPGLQTLPDAFISHLFWFGILWHQLFEKKRVPELAHIFYYFFFPPFHL